MADLTLPEVITRFRSNEARIADFTNGNTAGYYTTVDGKKVETLPSMVTRLAAAITAASAARNDLAAATGSTLVGHGNVTLKAYLDAQATAQSNIKAMADAALPRAGGTLTGPLILAADPTTALHPATKGWTETFVGTYWKFGIGDTLISTQAPDSTWVPTGAIYLQSQYPKLFEKLGKLADWRSDQARLYTVSGAPYSWLSSAAGGGKFVLAGINQQNNYNQLCVSGDSGLTWTEISQPANNQIYTLMWNGSKFIGLLYGTTHVMASTDGLKWSLHQNILPSFTNSWTYITYGNGIYLASIDGENRMARNAGDPTTLWSTVNFPDGFTANYVIFMLGLFCAFTGSSTYYTSPDGVTWTKRTLPFSNIRASCASDTVAVINSAGTIWISNNAIDWTQTSTLSGIGRLHYGGGYFLSTTGTAGLFYVSIDGVKWTSIQLPFTATTSSSFTYADGVFVSGRYNNPDIFRIKAFSYNTSSQFFTTIPNPTLIGVSQFMKAQ
ncbi:hypothetical protein [Pseudomonas oryzihabitans]|uniref:Uncharacterized protein n=1 Tax=Pseudomonas oryzihabitans TaxID=47885 RepID=A0AAJ2EYQ8_9PSED|nr:hypothetical protein [Pseudomonas psychrotolerans]MDR6233535.1 hypothetical protein [Pseudomonas psychrotolerans]MDR6357424.1 hypothetical protein [Pseudomonas psychrotolerans]